MLRTFAMALDWAPSEWFNPAAFALQPAGSFGNAGRNSIVGPGSVTCDFSTNKSFRMPAEGHTLQFRWEAFNAANHPVWALPDRAVNNTALFGKITGTVGNMRQMQFAPKYIF